MQGPGMGGGGLYVKCEESTTAFHTGVWRNSVVWCTGRNTAQWLARKKPIACIFILGTYKKRVSRPITALYFRPYIETRIFAKRQC